MKRLVALLLAAAACDWQGRDVDARRYHCSVDSDCGPGVSCIDGLCGGSSATGGGAALGGGGNANGGGTANGGGVASTGGGVATGGGATGGGGGSASFDDGGRRLPANAFCTRDNWCWENPTPMGGNWYDGWADSNGDLWTVGSGGVIARWHAGRPTLYESGGIDDFYSVWGASPNEIWAVGFSGAITAWDGQKWTLTYASSMSLQSVTGTGPDDVWAGGDVLLKLQPDSGNWLTVDMDSVYPLSAYRRGEVIALTVDAGLVRATASTLDSLPTDDAGFPMHIDGNGLAWIDARADNDIYVAGPGVDHWDGTRWSNLGGLENTNFVLADVPGHPLAINSAGVVRWNGTAWDTLIPDDAGCSFGNLTAGGGQMWAVGWPCLSVSTDGGSWQPVVQQTQTLADSYSPGSVTVFDATAPGSGIYSTSTTDFLLSVEGVWRREADGGWPLIWPDGTGAALQGTGEDAWVVTTDGRILIFPSVGPPTTLDAGAGLSFTNLWVSAPNDVWIVGTARTVLHYDGTRFVSDPFPVDVDLNMVYSSAGTTWIAGAVSTQFSSSFYRRSPNGMWTVLSYPGGSFFISSITALWGTSTNDLWIGIYGGGIAHSTNGGASFDISAPMPLQVGSIFGSGPSDVYAAGAYTGLIHYDGVFWSQVQTGAGDIEIGYAKPNGEAIAVGGGGTIIRHYP